MRYSKSIVAKLMLCGWSCCCLASGQASAAPGSLDTNFNAVVSGNFVHSVAAGANGQVLIGGNFSTVNRSPRSCVAQLNADGTLDGAFNPGTGANAEVLAVACQQDGKVLIGGSFTSVNRVPRNRLARLNADGTVDTGFNPGSGGNLPVRAIRVQEDGRILIGGQFTLFNGVPRSCVARLNPDGSLDAEFNPGKGAGGTFFVNVIAFQADGQILVGGDFSSFDGVPCGSIVRLNPDGSLDGTFDSGKGTTPDNPIISLAVQADGKIVIAGSFYNYQGVSRVNIARLQSDGSLDTSFNPGKGISGGLYNMMQTVAVRADGKILVGGSFDKVNGVAHSNLVLLNPDGSMDADFMTKVDSPVRSLVVQADGALLMGGEFNRVDGVAHTRVARLQGSAPAPVAALSHCRFGLDGFRCQVHGEQSQLVVEASADLVTWVPVSTNLTLNPSREFQDSTAANLPFRFYRVRGE